MARKLNLGIDQGADFTADVFVSDVNGDGLDLTGYTANAEMKHWYTSDNTIPFSVDMTNAANGYVLLTMNSATTMTLEHERYVYDLIVTDAANTVTRIIEGIVMVDPGVSNVTDDDD
jgi:hypothetical protein